MKVYELMEKLSIASSGAEVKFSSIITIPELIKFDEIDNGEYCYDKKVTDVDIWDETEIFLG